MVDRHRGLCKLSISPFLFGILTPKEIFWGLFFLPTFFFFFFFKYELKWSRCRLVAVKQNMVKHRHEVVCSLSNYCLGRSSCSCFLFTFTALRNCCMNNWVLNMSLPDCYQMLFMKRQKILEWAICQQQVVCYTCCCWLVVVWCSKQGIWCRF